MYTQLLFFSLYLSTLCNYQTMKSYYIEQALWTTTFQHSPDAKQLLFLTVSEEEKYNFTLDFYGMDGQWNNRIITPHPLDDHHGMFILWKDREAGPIIFFLNIHPTVKLEISTWTKDLTLNTFYSETSLSFFGIDFFWEQKQLFIFASKKQLLEQYTFSDGKLIKHWQKTVNQTSKMVIYSSRRSLRCWSVYKWDIIDNKYIQTTIIRCQSVRRGVIAYETTINKLVSWFAPAKWLQQQTIYMYILQQKSYKFLKMIIKPESVQVVQINMVDLGGKKFEYVYACEQKMFILFKLDSQLIITQQNNLKMQIIQTLELHDFNIRQLLCYDAYIARFSALGKFGIAVEEHYHAEYILIPIAILALVIIISLVILKKLFFILKKSIISYFRSKKIIIMFIVIGVSLLNSALCMHFTENELRREVFADSCYSQFLLITMAFSILECSEEAQEQKKYINLMKIRGLSIFYYYFCRLYEFFIVITLLGVTTISLQNLLQIYLIPEQQYFEDFSDVIVNFAGFFLCALSSLGLSLVLILIVKNQWIAYRLLFLHYLFTLSYLFSFEYLMGMACPFNQCELLYYNGVAIFPYIIHSKREGLFQKKFNSIRDIGTLLVIATYQILAYFILYLIIILVKTYAPVRFMPTQKESLLSLNRLSGSQAQQKLILRVTNLRKEVSKQIVFSNVSFEVKAGGIFVIYGDSKSGKSTLIQTILGLQKAKSGDILFERQTVVECCLQEPLYFQHLTFIQHIRFYLLLHGYKKNELEEKIQQYVDDFYFENDKNKRAKELSGGNLKKLCLACAFIRRKALIFLDEPTLGVDVRYRRVLWDYLRRMRAQGSTIIIATSDLEELEHVADYIYSLKANSYIESINEDEKIYQMNSTISNFPSFQSSMTDKRSFYRDNLVTIKKDEICLMNSVLKAAQESNNISDLRFLKFQPQFMVQRNIEEIKTYKKLVPVILLRQLYSIFKYRFLLIKWRSQVMLSLFSIAILLKSTTLLCFAPQEFFKVGPLMIRIITFLHFPQLRSLMTQKEKETVENNQIIGLHVGCYWLGNFLFDLCAVFLTLLIYFVSLFILSNQLFKDEFLQTILLWGFFYALNYVAFIYAISTFIRNSTIFLFLVFYLNAFILQNFINGRYFYNQTDNIIEEIRFYYFPFVFSLSQDEDENKIQENLQFYLFYQALFWLSFFVISQFLKRKLKFFRIKVNVADLKYKQNQDLIREQFDIQDRNRLEVPLIADFIFKSYNKNEYCIRNVSIIVKEGEVYGLMGANGAGKSTLFKILTIKSAAQIGKIEYYGKPFHSLGFIDHLLVGYCPQFDYLHDSLTVQQNISFISKIKGLCDQEIMDFQKQYLPYFQLEDTLKLKVKKLSEGQKKKLCSLLAFIGHPKILFFDEPSAGMQVESRSKLWQLIRSYAKDNNAAVVLTTHNIRSAEKYCDRVGLLSKGQLVAVGPPAEINSRFSAKYRLILKYRKLEDVNKIRSMIEEEVFYFTFDDRPQKFTMFYDLPVSKTDCHKLRRKVWEEIYVNCGLISYFEFYRHGLQEVISQLANSATRHSLSFENDD